MSKINVVGIEVEGRPLTDEEFTDRRAKLQAFRDALAKVAKTLADEVVPTGKAIAEVEPIFGICILEMLFKVCPEVGGLLASANYALDKFPTNAANHAEKVSEYVN